MRVAQQAQIILPIEVKSGSRGAMQSLHLFLKERKDVKNIKTGIRFSGENFTRYDDIRVMPAYAVPNLYTLYEH